MREIALTAYRGARAVLSTVHRLPERCGLQGTAGIQEKQAGRRAFSNMKWIRLPGMCVVGLLMAGSVAAQAAESRQLALDLQKLAQLKLILQDMYQGYRILESGYNGILELSKQNYSLHEAFLDRLLQVSPAVRNSRVTGDIIRYQSLIVRQGSGAAAAWAADPGFSANERLFFRGVYKHLLQESQQELTELAMVLSPGKLRMSDDERLDAIDGIESRSEQEYTFLHSFGEQVELLSQQRRKALLETSVIKKLYGNHE